MSIGYAAISNRDDRRDAQCGRGYFHRACHLSSAMDTNSAKHGCWGHRAPRVA